MKKIVAVALACAGAFLICTGLRAAGLGDTCRKVCIYGAKDKVYNINMYWR